jgi:hypothetical protein
MLYIDGHSSHCTIDFLQYVEDHDIIIYLLLPHTTYLIQPCDVGLFQPYKHHYGKAVVRAYNNSCFDFDKMSFLDAIHLVRLQAMKTTTIKHAWACCGLRPYDPDVVCSKLEQALEGRTPSPLGTPGLEERLVNMEETPRTGRSLERYCDAMVGEHQDHPDASEYLDRFVCGSLQIVHAFNALKRTIYARQVAEKRRKQLKKDARRSLQKGGVMTVAHGRSMAKAKDQKERDAAEKKAAKVVRIAANKAKKEEQAIAVAGRKAIRLENKQAKDLGTTTKRVLRNTK